MKFAPTPLDGACLVEPELLSDARGFFARVFCTEEMAAHGLDTDLAQASISFNHHKGTLRGMHFQADPHAEVKLVRCTAGAIFDVIVDVRPHSPTHGQWFGTTLTADNRHALYIPKGFAHGFQTLTDNAEVLYLISVPFAAGFGRCFRWDDPAVGIAWPAAPTVVSDRDAAAPTLAELQGA